MPRACVLLATIRLSGFRSPPELYVLFVATCSHHLASCANFLPPSRHRLSNGKWGKLPCAPGETRLHYGGSRTSVPLSLYSALWSILQSYIYQVANVSRAFKGRYVHRASCVSLWEGFEELNRELEVCSAGIHRAQVFCAASIRASHNWRG